MWRPSSLFLNQPRLLSSHRSWAWQDTTWSSCLSIQLQQPHCERWAVGLVSRMHQNSANSQSPTYPTPRVGTFWRIKSYTGYLWCLSHGKRGCTITNTGSWEMAPLTLWLPVYAENRPPWPWHLFSPLLAPVISRWDCIAGMTTFDGTTTLQFTPGQVNVIADLLSCSVPAQTLPTKFNHIESEIIHMLHTPLGSTVTLQDLREASEQDPVIYQLCTYICQGWPRELPQELSFCNDICVAHELCTVIPGALHARVLSMAHEGHLGIVKLKQRCHNLVWWQGIDKDIEALVNECPACLVSGKIGRQGVSPALLMLGRELNLPQPRTYSHQSNPRPPTVRGRWNSGLTGKRGSGCLKSQRQTGWDFADRTGRTRWHHFSHRLFLGLAEVRR